MSDESSLSPNSFEEISSESNLLSLPQGITIPYHSFYLHQLHNIMFLFILARVPDDVVLFKRIIYLGSASVNESRSETELSRVIADLNQSVVSNEVLEREPESTSPHVILSIGLKSTGSLRLLLPSPTPTAEPPQNLELVEFAGFPLADLLFCARGCLDSPDERCFAFTVARDRTRFQCHVLRCADRETVLLLILRYISV